jgi:prepilin-type processing-associated H-X9-DG protein
MFDATQGGACLGSKVGPPPYEGCHDPDPSARVCINRHDGGTNFVFLDWSVRKVGLKELWTLKWDREHDTAGPWTKAGGVRPEDWPEWMRRFKDY